MDQDFLSIDDVASRISGRLGRTLTEAEAIEIWIARWLRIPRKELLARYGCNSTRLYEIWWGERFPASRARAAEEFRRRYPELTDRTVFGYKRIRRVSLEPIVRQPDLFG